MQGSLTAGDVFSHGTEGGALFRCEVFDGVSKSRFEGCSYCVLDGGDFVVEDLTKLV